MFKVQLHTHASGDPVDHIKHSPEELIDEAAKLQYKVLSITCHRKLLFTAKLKEYAAAKGILLLPGIEFEIGKKHLLCINADEDISKVDNFEKLRAYRKKHPESLIIAPHPFFPGPSLQIHLLRNIDLFDAIEISWAYTELFDFNDKAIFIAKKYQKPLIATSDCHDLRYLDKGYAMLDCKITPPEIVQAIRENRLHNFHRPAKIWEIFSSLFSSIFHSKISI